MNYLFPIFVPILRVLFRNKFCSPTICGFQEDPLCGYGPKIKDAIKHDEFYKKTGEELMKLLRLNFRNLELYVRRFEGVRQTTNENIMVDRPGITDEIGKRLRLCKLIRSNRCKCIDVGTTDDQFNSILILT